MLPLALVHEGLFVGGPVQPLCEQHALTVPTGLVVGFAVFAFDQLHIPPAAHATGARSSPRGWPIYRCSVTETIILMRLLAPTSAALRAAIVASGLSWIIQQIQ